MYSAIVASPKDVTPEERELECQELWCGFTLLYVLLEVARVTENEKQKLAYRSTIRAYA